LSYREKTVSSRCEGLASLKLGRILVKPNRANPLRNQAFPEKIALFSTFLLACAQFWPKPVFPSFTPIIGAYPSPQRMASEKELSSFLESVEKRAFKQAVYAVRKDEAALDIVQDAMIKLSQSYGHKPAAELPLLFQRILQNTVHDYFRREKVRGAWISLFSSLSAHQDDAESDMLETFASEQGSEAAESSEDKVERAQVLQMIDDEVQKLPPRQREAFLLRYWHDMDVAEAAAAMGCAEGTVKTHCSRATHALAIALKAKGVSL
jgi:RNA polymerase sigma-70 factor, ECF subfamily